AMAHRHLGNQAKARECYDKAAREMDQYVEAGFIRQDEKVCNLRAEAAELLGVRYERKTPPPAPHVRGQWRQEMQRRADLVVLGVTIDTFRLRGQDRGILLHFYSGYLDVLLGNGDGTFRAGSTTLIVDRTLSLSFVTPVVKADFNRDGKLDVFCFGYLLPGNGDGTLRLPIVIARDATDAADVNGDGNVDLLGSYSLSLGNGDGTFQAPLNYPLSANSLVAAVGDFNGDGKLDLATQNYDGTVVGVLLGDGDGTFRAA